MNRRLKRASLLTCVALAIAFLLPASALAATRYTSRIYGLKSAFTVDNSDPATTAVAPVATGKLQRYYGGRWVGFNGTVRLYRFNDDTGAWSLVAQKYVRSGTSFRFGLTQRGAFKVAFSGSTSTKPTYRRTSRFDKIVSSFPEASIVTTDLGNGTSAVTLSQQVSWNEAAYPDQFGLLTQGFISIDETSTNDTDTTMLIPTRTIRRPGTYQVTFVVDNIDLFPTTMSMASVVFFDDYVLGADNGQGLGVGLPL